MVPDMPFVKDRIGFKSIDSDDRCGSAQDEWVVIGDLRHNCFDKMRRDSVAELNIDCVAMRSEAGIIADVFRADGGVWKDDSRPIFISKFGSSPAD